MTRAVRLRCLLRVWLVGDTVRRPPVKVVRRTRTFTRTLADPTPQPDAEATLSGGRLISPIVRRRRARR